MSKNKDPAIIRIRLEIIIQYRTILTRRLSFMCGWIFDNFMPFISASIDTVRPRGSGLEVVTCTRHVPTILIVYYTVGFVSDALNHCLIRSETLMSLLRK